MSQTYRFLIAAVAGLIALFIALGAGAYFGALYAPQHQYHSLDTAIESKKGEGSFQKNGLTDVSGIDEIAERVIAKPQPRNSDDRLNRDLAAQESMAVFNYWMFWGIVFQTLLAGGAFVALLVDLRQNRSSAEKQLRAYLVVEPEGIREFKDGKYAVPLKITNTGQTPAYQLEQFGDFVAFELDPRFFDREEHGRSLEHGAQSDGILGPNSERYTFAYIREENICPEIWQAVSEKKMALIHYGYFRYIDAFGDTRITNFSFYHWGEELSDVESMRTRLGNSAT